MRRRIITYNLTLILFALLLWEALAQIVHSRYFPGPVDVVKSFIILSTKGDVEGVTLLTHAFASILRVLLGFSVAVVTGIPLGIAMGLRSEVYDVSKGVLEPLRFIPPIAWIPLTIILLSGYARYTFLIWLGAFFPILLNSIAGVKRVNPVLIDVAKAFGGKGRSIVLKIVVPGALPEIMTGMRVGIGIGWMCIVAAEMIGGEVAGLGWLILKSGELLDVSGIIVGMITVGLIGLAISELFLLIEKRVFKWRVEVRL